MSNCSPVPNINPFVNQKKDVKTSKEIKASKEIKSGKEGKAVKWQKDDIEEEDEEDIDEDEDDEDEDEDDDDEDDDEDDEDEDEDSVPDAEPQSMVFGEVLDSVLSRHFEYSQDENTLSMAEIMLLIKQSIDAQTAVLSELLRLKISKYGANRSSSSSKEKETPEERVIRKQREATSRR